MNTLDWTHKEVKISDIRKLNDFYIFTIFIDVGGPFDKVLNGIPLMVKDTIFNERLRTYFLKDPSRIDREEILKLKWNMYITKGHYIKIIDGEPVEHKMDEKKYYVSYLEVAGPLGTFSSVYKDKE